MESSLEKKYQEFIVELEKLKDHVTSLENEGKTVYKAGNEGNKYSVEYRKAYYAGMKKIENLVDIIVELNCAIEMQLFNEPLKEDLQLVLDIPHVPVSAERYEMRYIDGDSPWNFWLSHTFDKDDFQALQTSLWDKAISGLLEKLDVLPLLGDYVCYPEGNQICRGTVTEIYKCQRLKVLNVDTGAVRIIPVEKAYKIDEEVATVYCQAVNCFLIEDSEDAHLWTGELQRIFSSVLKCDLSVEIVKKKDGIPPSFLVKIAATDCGVNNMCNSGDIVTVNVEEWVCERILPELKRTAQTAGGIKNNLSISAIDAFYKNSNSSNENYELNNCHNIKQLPSDVIVDNISKRDSPNDFDSDSGINSNCVNDASRENLDVNIPISSNSSLPQKINLENLSTVKEKKKIEADNSSVVEKYEGNRIANSDRDYLLSNIKKSHEDCEEKLDCCENSDFSQKSTTLVISELEDGCSDFNEPTIDQSICDNSSVELTDSNIANPLSDLLLNSVNVPGSGSAQSEASNGFLAAVSSSQINHTVTYPNSVNSSDNPVLPIEQCHKPISRHNSHQMTGPSLQYSSVFIKNPGYLWESSIYPSVHSYFNSSTVYKPPLIPLKNRVSANINMQMWSRPGFTVSQNTSNVPNYSPWSTGKEAVNYSNNGVNSNIVKTITESHNNNIDNSPMATNNLNICSTGTNIKNLISDNDSIGKFVETVVPATSYRGPKCELKQQISLIRPDEEISARISCVVSPDEIYVHLANENNIEIDSLQEALFQHYSVAEHMRVKSKKDGEIRYGQYCACFCKIEDFYGNENFKWYRAQIYWDEEKGDDVLAYLVDFGNKVKVGLSQIQPLIPKFTKHYMMAQRCHLTGIKCPSGGWPDSLCQYLKNLIVVSDDYSITVVPTIYSIKNSLEVVLFKLNEKSTSINSRVKNFLNFEDLLKEDEEIDETTEMNDLNWDPMKEDFESERNNYKLDQDDACVAVSGYTPKDEQRICKFYKQNGYCWKKYCPMEHVEIPDGVFTTDKEEVYQQAFNSIILPQKRSYIKLKVTNVFKANAFFAQIQDKTVCGSRQPSHETDDASETLSTLMTCLNKPSNIRELEDPQLPLIEGQLVIAKTDVGGTKYWFRARINQVNDNSTCSVFFVDFGSTDTVKARNIRAIQPKYLHLPFQAVECTLANVELKETEIDNEKPMNLLKELIECKTLNGIVHESYQELQRLEVILHDNDGCDISGKLIDSDYYIYIVKDNTIDYDGELPG